MSTATPTFTLEHMAEGRIATVEEIGISDSYHTPLTRLVVENMQTQCSVPLQKHARAMLVASEISPTELSRRQRLATLCLSHVLQRFNKCQREVKQFQEALVDPEPNAALKAELQLEAEGKLLYCARDPLKSNHLLRPSQPLPWYFKPKEDGSAQKVNVE